MTHGLSRCRSQWDVFEIVGSARVDESSLAGDRSDQSRGLSVRQSCEGLVPFDDGFVESGKSFGTMVPAGADDEFVC